MSDPVAKDVEDVLSSIRRLVSDTGPEGNDDSGTDDQSSDMHEPTRRPDVREALILTSALRVDPSEELTEEDAAATEEVSEDVAEEMGEVSGNEDDVPNEASAQDAPNDLTEGESGRSDLGSLRQAVSGAFMGEPVMPAVIHKTQNVKKAADVSSAIEATKSWGTRAPEDYYEDEELAAADMAGWDDDAVAEHVEEPPEEVTDRHNETMEAGADATADVHAFREDAPVHGEDWSEDVEPEVAEMASEDPSADASFEDETSDTGEAETAEAAGVQTDGISDEYEWDEHEEELENPVNIATFRHVPIDTHRTEPALVEETAPVEQAAILNADAASDLPAAESPEDEDVAEDAQKEAEEDNLKPIDLSDLDEAILDEETLRELVSDIVRKELSGELGERITRNVRKLVRREIHRALLTREFD